MDAQDRIDITFDFRSDTPAYPWNDPDALSPTLRRYHRLLWSKRLPCGSVFLLDDNPPHYLHHLSALGEFWLTSDSVVPTFSNEPRLTQIIAAIPSEEMEEFRRIGYTIGGMMVFPGNRVEGQMTINGARGLHPRIKDRFDLTIECIRRYYRNELNPLSKPLARYATFFGLFGDFLRYTEYFLLQDLVAEDFSTVRFFTPFDNFNTSPLPASIDAYRNYRQRAIEFIEARNSRILHSI
jgi:hypothetical protein